MPERSETLQLAVPPAEAKAICRRALSTAVWELEEDGADRLVAYEWPWRINCLTRPARIEARIVAAGVDRTTLRLDASVGGFGPMPSDHLRNHLDGLIGRIRSDIHARR